LILSFVFDLDSPIIIFFFSIIKNLDLKRSPQKVVEILSKACKFDSALPSLHISFLYILMQVKSTFNDQMSLFVALN